MRKVNHVAEVFFFFTKIKFSHLFLEEKQRQITPPLHPDLSEKFEGFPQRLRLSENQAPAGVLAGAYRPSMDLERRYFGWKSILHPNYGKIQFWPQLVTFSRPNTIFFPLMGSQCLISSQEGQPLRGVSKHLWEIWMEWGSNLSLFFLEKQVGKLKYEKERLWCASYFSHFFWKTLQTKTMKKTKKKTKTFTITEGS